MKCTVDGCERPSRNKKKPGLCRLHGQRKWLHGDVGSPESQRPRMPLEEKLLAYRHLTPDGCWEWTRGRDKNGYGFVYDGVRSRLAHRVAYTVFVGPIPDGLHLDHLCRNPPCINPAHLEPVTAQVNVLRGKRSALRDWPTECQRGHAYDAENTYWFRGQRRCRKCATARNRKFRARQRSLRRSVNEEVG